jgi:hypothetical protein
MAPRRLSRDAVPHPAVGASAFVQRRWRLSLLALLRRCDGNSGIHLDGGPEYR